MVTEKEKFIDYLRKVAPGNALRTVIDDLVRSDLGALIVFDSPTLQEQKLLEGGFRVNCRFTSQKLFELCKMDGAIVVSADLKRILQANVLITPDTTVYTNETGTRHKAAERAAKQANTFVIAVSERRKKTTLYLGGIKYHLKSSEEILRELSSNLQILEKQRENIDELLNNLNILEMSEMVSTKDICKLIQQMEVMLRITESAKRSFIELGKEGNIINMRYRELLRGIERKQSDLIRDYSSLTLKRTNNILSNLSFDGLLEIETIARLVIQKPLEEGVIPKGFRFLSHLSLSEKEISQLVKQFRNLSGLLDSGIESFETLLKNRAERIKEEIVELREQVLSGKVVC